MSNIWTPLKTGGEPRCSGFMLSIFRLYNIVLIHFKVKIRFEDTKRL
jgi:hypothetical protein